MARKKTDVAETPPEAQAVPDYPRKVIKTFSCVCGKDETLIVEIIETEFDGKDASKVTILNAECHRTYVNGGGEVKTSYRYRAQHLPILTHLLNLAHTFILSTRVVEDTPVV